MWKSDCLRHHDALSEKQIGWLSTKRFPEKVLRISQLGNLSRDRIITPIDHRVGKLGVLAMELYSRLIASWWSHELFQEFQL